MNLILLSNLYSTKIIFLNFNTTSQSIEWLAFNVSYCFIHCMAYLQGEGWGNYENECFCTPESDSFFSFPPVNNGATAFLSGSECKVQNKKQCVR